MHYCAYHKVEEEDQAFRLKPNGKLDSWCVEGRKERGRAYSKAAYEARKAEVARDKAEHEARLTQRCTRCGQERPMQDFLMRYDRPDKHEAQCSSCSKSKRSEAARRYNIENFEALAIKKREYHAAHPRYNVQSSRRRRAKLKRVRQEEYTSEMVRERDQGLCWFCHELVDPQYVWPDPRSEVIHHLHPISKLGPNVMANVALAHNRCNGRHKDKYNSPFVEGLWDVRPIDSALARSVAIREHYLHRAPNVSYGFGLYAGDHLFGIVTFGTPSSGRINQSIAPDCPRLVIELNRLWISPDAPHGAASWFVSRALRQLPPVIVVSYADTGILDERNQRAHNGSVYKALSFEYAGRTRPSKDWRMPGTTRNVGKHTPGSVMHIVTPKERFWTVTGNRREKKLLRSFCRWPSFAYE